MTTKTRGTIRQTLVRRLSQKMGNVLTGILSGMIAEASHLANANRYPLPHDWDTRWPRVVYNLRKKFVIEGVAEGRAFVSRQLRKAFDVIEMREQKIAEWLTEVGSKTTANLATKIEKLHDNYLESIKNHEADIAAGVANPRKIRNLTSDIKALSPAYDRNRAHMIAHTDINYAHNLGARLEYTRNGVEIFTWRTALDDAVCPFCSAMEGVQVGGSDPFWDKGEDMSVKDDSGSIQNLNLPHGCYVPPLHPRCACTIEAEIDYSRISPAEEILEPTPAAPTTPPELPKETRMIKKITEEENSYNVYKESLEEKYGKDGVYKSASDNELQKLEDLEREHFRKNSAVDAAKRIIGVDVAKLKAATKEIERNYAYHVVSKTYKSGDDLLPLRTQVEQGIITEKQAIASIRKKWPDVSNPIDYIFSEGQEVHMSATYEEALAYQREEVDTGDILRIDISDLSVRIGREYNHPVILGKIDSSRIERMRVSSVTKP